ncbi:MAG: hypothetical protein FJX29_03300 [Alphaproteobacteria bacterium]|nr:hypothetical protein [Alphaproteobacteria bacterium]
MAKETHFGKSWFRRFMAAVALGICAGLIYTSAASAKSLRIENKREVALSDLRITAKDGAQPQTYVIASDVAAGSRINAKVPPGQCLFDVTGVFADQSQLNAQDMDLCRQHTIRLVR